MPIIRSLQWASLPPYNRHCYYFWKTFVDLIITSCKGRSFLSVFTTEIFSTISRPSTTSPKIVTEPSRCGTPPIVLYLFKHWKLIFSNRNILSLECCDVCCLADRICHKANRKVSFKVSHFYLRLDSRVPFKS